MPDNTGLETIYRLEFSNRTEATVRYAAVGGAALLYFMDFDDPRAVVWALSYIATHVALHIFLVFFRHRHEKAFLLLGLVWVFTLMVTFLWYPLLQVLTGELTGAIGGATFVICTFLYALARNDRDKISISVWGVTVTSLLLILVIGFIPRADSIWGVTGIIASAPAVGGYFGLAMATSRRLKRENNENAIRDAQEQKLAAIGRLAGGVAHDFNNALTGISGNLELFFEIEDPKEREELLRNAQQSAERAAHLVQQLLVFSRKSDMERGTIDVNDIVAETASFQRRLLPASVTMQVAPWAGAVTVEADKSLLVTAMINLAVNAVDAMPGGGVLTLASEVERHGTPIQTADGRVLPEGRYARLSVSDTGHGIPEHLRNRVIEPFFSTKPAGKGSGLGLSMVSGLAHSLNGGLLINTGPQGTTVAVLLPLKPQSRPDIPQTQSQAKSQAQEQFQPKSPMPLALSSASKSVVK